MDALSIIVVPRSLTETVEQVLPQVLEVASRLERPTEVFCLEDAAHPCHPKTIHTLAQFYPQVRVISIDPPLGSTAAMGEAIALAQGSTLAVLDGSGHYPVEELPRLLSRLVRVDAAFAVPRRHGPRRWLRSIVRRWNAWQQNIELDRPVGWMWVAQREAIDGISFASLRLRDIPREIVRRGYRIGQIHVDCRAEIRAADDQPCLNSAADKPLNIHCHEHQLAHPPGRRAVA